jgi:hypothetical protein
MRHFPMADIMPGQLAPTRRVLDWVFSIEWICLNVLERHSASLGERESKLMFSYTKNIMDRNMFRNSNNKRNLRFDGFLDCLGRLCAWDIDG